MVKDLFLDKAFGCGENVSKENFAKIISQIYSRYDNTENFLCSLINDCDSSALTVNVGRSGRLAVWYLDEDREEAYYLDTAEKLSSQEIEKEFY